MNLEKENNHPPPSKCRGHERVGLYLYSPSGPSWPVIGTPNIKKFKSKYSQKVYKHFTERHSLDISLVITKIMDPAYSRYNKF